MRGADSARKPKASIRRSIGSSTDKLCTSSANEDRQCHNPTCHETKFEVCFLHSYLLGLLCVGYSAVLVVSGNLTQQSDGSLCLLNLLIRQADRTIGLLAPMLPLN